MRAIYLFLILLISHVGFSQVDTNVVTIDSITSESVKKVAVPGKLKVYEDSYYEAVKVIQKRINGENCPNLVKGYRVQVFSCSGGSCKDKADKYYNQFLIAYPDLAVYKLWQPPSLKVRTGNCRNRFEAEAIKKLIEKDFPFVFIVPDYIETTLMVNCEEMDEGKKENTTK